MAKRSGPITSDYKVDPNTGKGKLVARANKGRGTAGDQYGDPGPAGVSNHSGAYLPPDLPPSKKLVRGA